MNWPDVKAMREVALYSNMQGFIQCLQALESVERVLKNMRSECDKLYYAADNDAQRMAPMGRRNAVDDIAAELGIELKG
jgi:hypothetical protein